MSTSFSIYFDQLLKTATNGNVKAEYAFHTQRVRAVCGVCDETLTVLIPEVENELGYGIQEFIKIHAHVGGHKDCTCSHKEWAFGAFSTNMPHALSCPKYTIGISSGWCQVCGGTAVTGHKSGCLHGVDPIEKGNFFETKDFTIGKVKAVTCDFKPVKPGPKPLKIATGRKFR